MPLKDYGRDQPVYLDRHRVFVDSREKIRTETRSDGREFWVGEYSVGTELSDVVGFELVGYQLMRAIAPTFWREGTGKGTGPSGNNWLDIRIGDVPETASLEFSVEFEPGTLIAEAGNLTAFDRLLDKINNTLYSLGDATFNAANGYVFDLDGRTNAEDSKYDEIVSEGTGLWFPLILKKVLDSTVCSLQLKFGTGEHAANSAWNVLGYEEGVDAVGSGGLTQPAPIRPVTLRPVRYVDVIVEEAGERRNPVHRIYLEDGKPAEYTSFYAGSLEPTSTTRTEPPSSRVLDNESPRNMRTIRVSLEFEGGVVPPSSHELHYDLVFDILHLSPEQSVPNWVQQGFRF